MSDVNKRKHQARKRSTYLAGHRDGWVAALRLVGLDPDKFQYNPPAEPMYPTLYCDWQCCCPSCTPQEPTMTNDDEPVTVDDLDAAEDFRPHYLAVCAQLKTAQRERDEARAELETWRKAASHTADGKGPCYCSDCLEART